MKEQDLSRYNPKNNKCTIQIDIDILHDFSKYTESPFQTLRVFCLGRDLNKGKYPESNNQLLRKPILNEAKAAFTFVIHGAILVLLGWKHLCSRLKVEN